MFSSTVRSCGQAFTHRFASNYLFGCCYKPPSDSQYCTHFLYAAIEEKLQNDRMSQKCIIIGDMNARFGILARELLYMMELPMCENFSFPVLPDEVRFPNENAFILASICQASKLILINNFKTPDKHFMSNKTYRKGDVWVSELDSCPVSAGLVGRVDEFFVCLNDSFPSDHAPVAVSLSLPTLDLENLCIRACQLGDHAVLYESCNTNQHVSF